MSDNPYSKTVILPKTDFDMKASLKDREPAQMEIWKKDRIFQKMKEKRKNSPRFVLHDGPPYANGNFHVGHALNKILKDFIVKSRHLAGFHADIVPGWDCHGLPIEVQVLKDLGKEASKIGPSELRKKCREYAAKYVGIQGSDFSRFLCFWDEESRYLTMDPSFEAEIVRTFGTLFEKGYIYKGKKPVYWCIQLGTAHAEAEIEYQDHVSPSVYVKFPVIGKDRLFCLIWTTTPWTLPANLAVCFNEEISYSIFESEGDRLILADGLAESVEKATGRTLSKKEKITHDEIRSLKFQHPFLDRISIPLFGSHVTLDAGTGCVHTAPGHGADDYKVGMKAGLELLSPVDDRGRFTDEFPLMKGVQIFEANPKIIELLKEKNALFFQSEIKHSYPHSWRSKKPLIFRATPQWFFSIDEKDLRKRSLDAIEKVKWVPDWGITRIRSMVENRPDWCLSRQRNWGVPIPSFTCADCGATLMNEDTIEFFIEKVRKIGIDIWFELDTKDLLPAGTKCAACSSSNLKKDHDILDVWFDSGVSNFAVFGADQKSPPADLYLEGTDQHRGWFQSSLWPSMALRNFPPYKSVLTHGYVLDEKGHAMSKSMGNVINPTTDIINIYGADILRLWVASQDFKDDVRIGKDGVKIISEQYRKLRNTFRYLLGNLNGFEDTDRSDIKDMDDIDLYYLHQLSILNEEIKNHYENYQFYLIYQKVLKFCSVDLSQDYFEMIRDRMYCDRRDSKGRRSSCTALSIIFDTLSVLLSPVLSFTSEEAWKSRGRKESVFLQEFGSLKKYENPSLAERFRKVLEAKSVVQKALEEARQKGKIGKSLEAAVELEKAPFLQDAGSEKLEMIFTVSQVRFKQTEGADVLSSREENGIKVNILYPKNPECPRCWRHTADTSEGKLCKRCEEAV